MLHDGFAKKQENWRASFNTRCLFHGTATVLLCAFGVLSACTLEANQEVSVQTDAVEEFSAGDWCVDVPKRSDLVLNPTFEKKWRRNTCLSGRWLDENLCASDNQFANPKKNRLCAEDQQGSWLESVSTNTEGSFWPMIASKLAALEGTFAYETSATIDPTRIGIWHRFYQLRVGKGFVTRADPVNAQYALPKDCTRSRHGRLSCEYGDKDYLDDYKNAGFLSSLVWEEEVAWDPNYNCHGYVLQRALPSDGAWKPFQNKPVFIRLSNEPFTGHGDKYMEMGFSRVHIWPISQDWQTLPSDLAEKLQDKDVLAFYQKHPDEDPSSINHSALAFVKSINPCNGISKEFTIRSKLGQGPLVKHRLTGIKGLFRIYQPAYLVLYRLPSS